MGMRFSKSNSMSLSTNRIDDYRRELSGACESGVTVKKRGGGGIENGWCRSLTFYSAIGA